MSEILQKLRNTSALSGGNAAFIESLYERFLQDPESVDPAWRRHFETLSQESDNPPARHRPWPDQIQLHQTRQRTQALQP